MINRTPLKDAMTIAGCDLEGCMVYQDYLNIVVNDCGGTEKPITETQWEMMVDIIGKDRPYYASNVKSALKCADMKKKLKE